MKKAKLWEKFLDKHFCSESAYGNRPCDDGMLCDKCQYEWVGTAFKVYCEDHGLKE